MADEKYNGWTNRETWVVNVHGFLDDYESAAVTAYQEALVEYNEALADYTDELAEYEAEVLDWESEGADPDEKPEPPEDPELEKPEPPSVYDIAQELEAYFDDYFADELDGLSPMLKDLMREDKIDWYDLAEHMVDAAGEE